MAKGKNGMKVIVAIMLCMSAVVVSVQVRQIFSKDPSADGGDTSAEIESQLAQVVEYNNNARAELDKLTKEYDARIKSLGDNQIETNIKDIYSKLDQVNIIAGLKDVSGSGIIFSIDDKSKDDVGINDDPVSSIVHSYQVYRIINELKKAGAQAISVNGERMLPVSEIFCSGGTLKINGNMYVPPYVIKAIGNPNELYRGITSSEIYSEIMYRKLNVSLTKETELVISKYNGNIQTEIDRLTEQKSGEDGNEQ